jgi:hypothetical protein
MNRTKIGSTYYLVLGLVLFPLGLLMLLRISPVIDLITQFMPGIQTVQIFGLILQFFGEGLICFGIIGSISGKVIASTEYSRQILVASGVQRTQEQTALITGFKRNIDEQIAQLHAKLNQLQAQRATLVQSPSKCRFCGTKIEQGRFCPSCGKAN